MNQHQTKDPFALNPQDYPFLDVLLIQCVAGAASLHWESGGGGFFVEAEQLPLAHFEEATLVTGRGKRVAGFAPGRAYSIPSPPGRSGRWVNLVTECASMATRMEPRVARKYWPCLQMGSGH